MELSTAQNDDFGRVVEIYNLAIPSRLSTADTTLATVESKRQWLQSHSQSRPLYVVKLQNKIVGWASFQSFYGRPAYHATVELSIYIDPAYQNKGIGSTVLKECIDKAPGLGITNILGFVFAHNIGSIKLLKKHGFVQWGNLPEVAEMDGKLYSLTIQGFKVETS